ncbi:MAG: class I SAM-dependent methyltransferase, partial [Woeseia sp.]
MSAKPAIARGKKLTMADKADIHELYEKSVQNVEHEVEFLQKTFQAVRGRTAHVLREDFCGTASVCCEWVRQGQEFQAFGVDIDPAVLEWSRGHRVARLSAADQARVS